MLCLIVSYCFISRCIIRRHIVLCQVVRYHVVSCSVGSHPCVVLCRDISYSAISCPVIADRVVSYHVTRCVEFFFALYRTILDHVFAYRFVTSCRIQLCYIISYRVVSNWVVWYQVVSHRVVLCCVILWCVVSHRILYSTAHRAKQLQRILFMVNTCGLIESSCNNA